MSARSTLIGGPDARFDVDLLDEESPFEIDSLAIHLFKHPYLGLHDLADMWASDPLLHPARPPAHWLMVAEVAGEVIVAPRSTTVP